MVSKVEWTRFNASLSTVASIFLSEKLIFISFIISLSLTSLIFSAKTFAFFSSSYCLFKYISISGVLGVLLASKISISLGRPEVTCISATPAKWNTFNAICVDGSPNDWAVIIPIASPGLMSLSSCNLATSFPSSPYKNWTILPDPSLTVLSYSTLMSWRALANLLYK